MREQKNSCEGLNWGAGGVGVGVDFYIILQKAEERTIAICAGVASSKVHTSLYPRSLEVKPVFS